jgi:hypothetical protein
MSQNVLISNVEEGMVLAESLTNSFGQILMPAGTTIKQNHLRVLKTWNIRSIKVKSEENEEDIVINKELIKLAQAEIAKRLNWLPKIEQEKELYRIGVFQTALNLSKVKINNDD